jgi:hypothetical protein
MMKCDQLGFLVVRKSLLVGMASMHFQAWGSQMAIA